MAHFSGIFQSLCELDHKLSDAKWESRRMKLNIFKSTSQT